MSDIDRRMRERAREQRKRELPKTHGDTQSGSPLGDDQLLSDNTKETLRAAGQWAGAIGKRAAELTQKGVVIAAEKARDVKATVDAKRAKDAEARSHVGAAVSLDTATVQSSIVEEAARSDCNEQELDQSIEESSVPVVEDGSGAQSTVDQLLFVADGVRQGNAPYLGVAPEDVVEAQTDAAAETTEGAPLAQPSEVKELLPEKEGGAIPDDQSELAEAPAVTNGVSMGSQDSERSVSQKPESKAQTSAVPEAKARMSGGSMTTTAAPTKHESRTRIPWMVGGVVAVALAAGAFYYMRGKDEQPQPSAPAPVAPKVSSSEPEPMAEVVDAPVVLPARQAAPVPAILVPEVDTPVPATQSKVGATALKQARATPSPSRATAPKPRKAPASTPDQKSDWQQKANADLDAWAKKAGIE